MATKSEDKFANLAIITTLESAANTLTFQKLEAGIGLMEKVGWIISAVEYFPPRPLAALFNADGDSITFGLSFSKSFAAATLDEISIIDLNQYSRVDMGAAASSQYIRRGLWKDFSTLPGGGLLVLPNPLYGFVEGTGLVSAAEVTCRIYYTAIALAPEDYMQLMEARNVLTA